MGCRTLVDKESGQACFYCSTTDRAFGPIFPSYEAAELFLKVHPEDPRDLTDKTLMGRFNDFIHDYVCECGELRDEDNAERMAYIRNPEGCRCENNGDCCAWCEAKIDVTENWPPLQMNDAGKYEVAKHERFQCSYCWQKNYEPPDDPVAWSGGFAPNH